VPPEPAPVVAAPAQPVQNQASGGGTQRMVAGKSERKARRGTPKK